MAELNNRHVTKTMPLTSPAKLKEQLHLPESVAAKILQHRQEIEAILAGKDPRPLVIVGPCSIHDPDAARDYARRLQLLQKELADDLCICMRVYFEKPRTTTGWKGLLNDPHLDDSYDMETGLRLARQLLIDIATIGLPAATEFLDPISPQYLSDCISWAAIGARTTESQTHREMASGLSMPVGFKNGTDGSLTVAMNAMTSAGSPHRFLGIDADGRVSMFHTEGNPSCHVVLRGGSSGPNYQPEAVQEAISALQKAKSSTSLLIDCSHGNSEKNHERQQAVLRSVGQQIADGQREIIGVMIESNLVAGQQKLGADPEALTYGQSITDACVDFDSTAAMLRSFAKQIHDTRSATTAVIDYAAPAVLGQG